MTMKRILHNLQSMSGYGFLIKFSLFFIFMTASLIDFRVSMLALLLIVVFSIFEFSYNSVIWFLLYTVCLPHAPWQYILFAVFCFFFIFLTRFVLDLIKDRKFLKSWSSITLLSLFGAIALLLLIPFTVYYSFMYSLFEVMAFFIFTLIFIRYEKIDIKLILKIFPIFIALYCIAYNFMGTMGWCEYRKIIVKGVNRFSLFIRDPNYTGGLALISLFCILILNKSKNIKPWLYYSLFIIFGIVLFNTISKAAFIVYALFVLVFVVYQLVIFFRTKNKEILKELLFHLLALVVVCLLSYKALIVMIGRLFSFLNVETGTEDRVLELTSNRSDIYLGYLKVIFESPSKAIFGWGVWAPMPTHLLDTHCILLSMLYRDGLLVTLLLISMYVVAFLKTKQKLKFLNVACSFLILLMYMSLSAKFALLTYIFVFIFVILVGVQEKQGDSLLDEDKRGKAENNNILIKNKKVDT